MTNESASTVNFRVVARFDMMDRVGANKPAQCTAQGISNNIALTRVDWGPSHMSLIFARYDGYVYLPFRTFCDFYFGVRARPCHPPRK